MTQDESKRKAAEAALPYIEDVEILGVGTGSTVNHFIDCLADFNLTNDIKGAVSSSIATTERLKKIGIPVMELSESGNLDVYVDGADEVNPLKELIKGGGGALTREKIVAAASKTFVCIADQSKQVGVLGAFPLPLEVIPLARSLVARKMVALGGQPEWRIGFTTDNGNWILDIHNLDLVDPVRMEKTINNLAGVVTCGLFALRPADLVLIATEDGIKRV